MRYKSCAIHFKHKYIVDDPYLTTLHKLHLALMAVGIYGEADACAFINMASLGEELDVERHTLHITRCLWRIEARDSASCTRVVPLPFLHISTQLGVGLIILCHAYHISKMK